MTIRRTLRKAWRMRHPVRYLRNMATFRGRYNFEPGWRKLHYTFVAADVVKGAFKPPPERVATERLDPGQGLVLRTIDPAEERRRAKARR